MGNRNQIVLNNPKPEEEQLELGLRIARPSHAPCPFGVGQETHELFRNWGDDLLKHDDHVPAHDTKQVKLCF